MAKRQKDKHGSTKHTHKAKDRVTRNQGWTQVLWKSKQFLLRMWHTYIVTNPVLSHEQRKDLTVITTNSWSFVIEILRNG
jgi:hypothetical protein